MRSTECLSSCIICMLYFTFCLVYSRGEINVCMYVRYLPKIVHQTHGDNFVNSYGLQIAFNFWYWP